MLLQCQQEHLTQAIFESNILSTFTIHLHKMRMLHFQKPIHQILKSKFRVFIALDLHQIIEILKKRIKKIFVRRM